MLRNGKLCEFRSMDHRHGVRKDKYRIGAHLACPLKRLVQFTRAEERKIDWISAQRLSGALSGLPLRLFAWMIGVREYRERAKFRKYVLEQLNPLSSQFERKERAAGEIAARLPQAFDHTQLDRVAAKGKEYGYFLYGCQRACCGTARHGKVYVTPLQFGYHLPQRLGIAGCVVQFKDDIFSLGIASLTQSFPKTFQERVGLGFSGHPKDTIDLCRLLRALRAATSSHQPQAQ